MVIGGIIVLWSDSHKFKNRMCTNNRLSSFIEAENAVVNYIIGYYSQVRRHSYNGGLTPSESEKRYWLEYNPWPKLVDHYSIPLNA